jgi:phosphohistidine phosphatase
VGHQPVLGQTIAQILGVNDCNLQVRKGSIWWLRAKSREQGIQTSLITVQSPEMM